MSSRMSAGEAGSHLSGLFSGGQQFTGMSVRREGKTADHERYRSAALRVKCGATCLRSATPLRPTAEEVEELCLQVCSRG
jgi:hypothetical protein